MTHSDAIMTGLSCVRRGCSIFFPQLNLSSFVFDFLGQIATNKFLLDLPTTVDDYTAMVLILIAMYISLYKIFK